MAAYPADNPHTVNLNAFAKDVADATGGKLQITVHAAASLFKAPEIKRAVQTGQAQVGEVLISLHENEDPIFGIDVVPFLATSYPEALKLWKASKPVVEKKLAAQGLMLLFAVPWGPQGIYAKKDINTLEDMKGLKWRAYNVGTARIAEIVGAQPVTIQAAELPQALATGVVNAFMTSGSTGYDSKAWETMTHFYDTQAWIRRTSTFVNKAAFDGLDKPTQEAILKAAASRGNARLEDGRGKGHLVSRPAQGQQDEGLAAEPRTESGPEEKLAINSPPTGSRRPVPKAKPSSPRTRSNCAGQITDRAPRGARFFLWSPRHAHALADDDGRNHQHCIKHGGELRSARRSPARPAPR